MHIHILGICGTFMGGIAVLARAAGHRVSGSDANVYPPMSTQLEAQGIALIDGYDPAQLDLRPDVVLVGNVMSRGNPLIERLLDSGLAFSSGPQWFAENMLRGREVAAVAGTHGKTTTASMLAWILQDAGREPGFLIGGIPANFGASASAGGSAAFVIEADEYDTAFFDKRAKFVHYRPRHLLLTNLEYDHADIYPDLALIQRQFHHLVRTVPASGRITWKPVTRPSRRPWRWAPGRRSSIRAGDCGRVARAARLARGQRLRSVHRDAPVGIVRWPLIGMHNVENGLAAVACAAGIGVCRPGRGGPRKIQRRAAPDGMRGEVGGIRVFDDFAHHPTAVALTIDGVRRQPEAGGIVAVLEPRSNTMRLGVHRKELADSLAGRTGSGSTSPQLRLEPRGVASDLGAKAAIRRELPELVDPSCRTCTPAIAL